MERRRFLRTCALVGGAAALVSRESSWADATPRYYTKTRLVDIHGSSIRIGGLAEDTNFVFHYPYAATPCFLLKLGRSAAAANDLRREDGVTYAWQGGIGPAR
ncbi:MAG TPA: twin-arginine translocation signal domain-containing protein, partial [Casimicrobiaceae bacterium]